MGFPFVRRERLRTMGSQDQTLTWKNHGRTSGERACQRHQDEALRGERAPSKSLRELHQKRQTTT